MVVLVVGTLLRSEAMEGGQRRTSAKKRVRTRIQHLEYRIQNVETGDDAVGAHGVHALPTPDLTLGNVVRGSWLAVVGKEEGPRAFWAS